jgi:AcrR family transcriptional regulator
VTGHPSNASTSRAGRAYDMAGRGQQSRSTKRRIAEAALELFKVRDYDDVSLVEIARAAGVSHQTVLNHFDTKAGVLPACAEVFSEQVAELNLPVTAGDPVSIVRVTCARYEIVGDVNARWADIAPRVPGLEPLIAHGRTNFQAWLTDVLGDLLPGPDEPDERRRVLVGVHAVLEVHTWRFLRRDLELTQADTEAHLTDLLLGVLARHRIPPQPRRRRP